MKPFVMPLPVLSLTVTSMPGREGDAALRFSGNVGFMNSLHTRCSNVRGTFLSVLFCLSLIPM